jgi:hypothetical protein
MQQPLAAGAGLRLAGVRLRLAGALLLATAFIAGCEVSGAGVPAEGADYTIGLEWGASGMPLMLTERGLSLEQLVRLAVHRTEQEQGAAAAHALLARLQPKHDAVRAASLANDRAAFDSAGVALRAEMAAVVVEALGPGTAGRVMEGAALAVDSVEGYVAASHEAAGQPTPVLEAMLRHAAGALDEARAALAAEQPTQALQLAAEAALVAGRIRMRATPAVVPPTMPRLLSQAWDKAVSDAGQTAAAAQFAPMREKNAALKASLRTRDLETVRAAQEALRSEQIRLVVSVLGDAAPRQVLDAGAQMAEYRATRAESMKAAGGDISEMEAALREAADLHAAGAAALEAQDLAAALDLALQAADKILHIRTG